MSAPLKHSAAMAKRHFPHMLAPTPNKLSAFRKNWLSDPSCYPLILIMGTAATFVVGVGASCILYNPDVQIDPKRRGDPMRNFRFG